MSTTFHIDYGHQNRQNRGLSIILSTATVRENLFRRHTAQESVIDVKKATCTDRNRTKTIRCDRVHLAQHICQNRVPFRSGVSPLPLRRS